MEANDRRHRSDKQRKREDWPPMPEWASVMTQDRDGEINAWAGLPVLPVLTDGQGFFYWVPPAGQVVKYERLRKGGHDQDVSDWQSRIITRQEWETNNGSE